jgi:Raf kinase inhibitor-like YbhB/YbcL family protein
MTISSTAFEHNASIPAKFTCEGKNINPPLAFGEVPDNTKSLTLIMEDPDVPKSIQPDGLWDHWLVWNMAPGMRGILEGQEPEGIRGKGTGGNLDYYGPCPPSGQRRYFFKLYALNTLLDLDASSSKADIERAMAGHIIEQAELIGLYARQ